MSFSSVKFGPSSLVTTTQRATATSEPSDAPASEPCADLFEHGKTKKRGIEQAVNAMHAAEAKEDLEGKLATFDPLYVSNQPNGAFSGSSSGFIGIDVVRSHWDLLFKVLDGYKSTAVGETNIGGNTQVAFKVWTGRRGDNGTPYKTPLVEALTANKQGRIQSGWLDWQANPFANVFPLPAGVELQPAESLPVDKKPRQATDKEIAAATAAAADISAHLAKHCEMTILTPSDNPDLPNVARSHRPSDFTKMTANLAAMTAEKLTPLPGESDPPSVTVSNGAVLLKQNWTVRRADGSIDTFPVDIAFSQRPDGKIGQLWVYFSRSPL